jgi:hypothetical protein
MKGNKNLCTEIDGKDDNLSVAGIDGKRVKASPLTVQ